MTSHLKTLRFGKARKIKKESDISRLFKNGRRWDSLSFVLIYDKSDLPHDRLGVTVSRKHGSAVTRNKIKRIFREIFRVNIRRNSPPFFDIIIKPRLKIAADGSHRLNVDELSAAFDKWQDEVKS